MWCMYPYTTWHDMYFSVYTRIANSKFTQAARHSQAVKISNPNLSKVPPKVQVHLQPRLLLCEFLLGMGFSHFRRCSPWTWRLLKRKYHVRFRTQLTYTCFEGHFRLCQWSWKLAWCSFGLVAHLQLWRAGTSESGWQRWWQLHRRMVRCSHGIDT